ncbi:uncharacterized protein PRCAT00000995001 [Priceomyces carsonii]|uniref:uncharacterized protein n=1 Tax=Priceomyces carsonii TaxID=28549 RepID=UPI002EDA43D2|nr:unnamed protein product [Priceomyces carsonii]
MVHSRFLSKCYLDINHITRHNNESDIVGYYSNSDIEEFKQTSLCSADPRMKGNAKQVSKLTEAALRENLAKLNSFSEKRRWVVESTPLENGKVKTFLRADYKFKTFARTWTFLNLVAQKADEMKHHPTIMTTYNKVRLELTTHDSGNEVTLKDLKLANEIVTEFNKPSDSAKRATKGITTEDLKKILSLSQARHLVDQLVSASRVDNQQLSHNTNSTTEPNSNSNSNHNFNN